MQRSLVKDVELHTPDMGWTTSSHEVVTGIEVPDSRMHLYSDWTNNQTLELSPMRQAMSTIMAKRLLDFCDITFCESNSNYDCHSFTSFLMGWQDETARGSSTLRINKNNRIGFNQTEINKPYLAYAPKSTNPYAHSFLGTERQGYGFGVAGPGMPLVVSQNKDLKQTFGVSRLYVRER